MNLLALWRMIFIPDGFLRTRYGTIVDTINSCALRPSRHSSGSVEVAGAPSGGHRRTPVILRFQESPVAACTVLMLSLEGSRFKVAFVGPPFLLTRRTSVESTVPPVVADPIHGDIINDSLVVDVNIRDSNVVHTPVVIEVPTSPISAIVAGTEVAESIVDSTIKADVRSPVTRVP